MAMDSKAIIAETIRDIGISARGPSEEKQAVDLHFIIKGINRD